MTGTVEDWTGAYVEGHACNRRVHAGNCTVEGCAEGRELHDCDVGFALTELAAGHLREVEPMLQEWVGGLGTERSSGFVAGGGMGWGGSGLLLFIILAAFVGVNGAGFVHSLREAGSSLWMGVAAC